MLSPFLGQDKPSPMQEPRGRTGADDPWWGVTTTPSLTGQECGGQGSASLSGAVALGDRPAYGSTDLLFTPDITIRQCAGLHHRRPSACRSRNIFAGTQWMSKHELRVLSVPIHKPSSSNRCYIY